MTEEQARYSTQTYSGHYFSPINPNQIFHLNDIVKGLENECRFVGQVETHYSVANHSVVVAQLMEMLDLGDPMEGLMHDAVESYLVDMPWPYKALLPDFCKMEDAVDRRIRAQFNLPLEKTEGCDTADKIALFFEASHLTKDRGVRMLDDRGLRDFTLNLDIPKYWLNYSEGKFMDHYNYLLARSLTLESL